MKNVKFRTVEEYLSSLPENLRDKLEKIRQTIKKAVPEAEEVISYNMPAYKLNRVLVYFAAFSNHIGFFPTASGVSAFKKELSAYGTSKGTIRFPLDKPIPYDLIERIVKFRAKENSAKTKY